MSDKDNILNEDELWYKTIQEDTIASYRHYVTLFPQGKKTDKARSLIKHYELIHENDLWEQAKSTNTIHYFESYLNETRLNTHSDEAIKMLAELKRENDVAGKQAADSSNADAHMTNPVSLPKKLAPVATDDSSAKHESKRTIYPALYFLLGILVITAGLAMWSKPGSTKENKYAGVDSIIIPVTKSTPATNLTRDASEEPVITNSIHESRQLPANMAGTAADEEPRRTPENVLSIKPVEVGKNTATLPDSPLATKVDSTVVEPLIEKDSIAPVREFKGPLKIPHGLQFSVILDEPLSSEEAGRDGTAIRLHCSENIEYGGQVIIAKGAPVVGRIVDVLPSTGRKKALIGFVIEQITAIDGTVLNIYSQRYHKSASEHGKPVSYTEGLVFYARLKRH